MPSWDTFGRLLRQLGEAWVESDQLADDPSPEASALRSALRTATGAVHAALDDDQALEIATRAVTEALAAVEKARPALARAAALRQQVEALGLEQARESGPAPPPRGGQAPGSGE
jgi:hypothetical protein